MIYLKYKVLQLALISNISISRINIDFQIFFKRIQHCFRHPIFILGDVKSIVTFNLHESHWQTLSHNVITNITHNIIIDCNYKEMFQIKYSHKYSLNSNPPSHFCFGQSRLWLHKRSTFDRQIHSCQTPDSKTSSLVLGSLEFPGQKS